MPSPAEYAEQERHDRRMAERKELAELRAALNIEHETQRQMLERLRIEWTPGEPFYALVEDEIVRLRAALVQIENWVGKLPSNMGEAALVFQYIEQACAVLEQQRQGQPADQQAGLQVDLAGGQEHDVQDEHE